MMKEQKGDIFSQIGQADAICITTNAITKKNGEAVCGAGIALAAANKWPYFPRMLGQLIKQRTSITQVVFQDGKTNIVAFPTKDDWRKDSRLDIIKDSAKQLKQLADFYKWKTIVLPRPGCSNGKLLWADVKPVLEKMLDDRFVIMDLVNE